MKLENRYLVMKWSDIMQLPLEDQTLLERILENISENRWKKGKTDLQCLVIEKDWPEYYPSLDLLSNRVDKEEEIKIQQSLTSHTL